MSYNEIELRKYQNWNHSCLSLAANCFYSIWAKLKKTEKILLEV